MTRTLTPSTRRRIEHRAARRHQCGLDHPLTAYLGCGAWPAHVRDISAGGVSILTSRPLEVGAFVLIKLEALGFCVWEHLEILRVSTLSPTCVIVSGRFSRSLTQDELEGLLEPGTVEELASEAYCFASC